MISCSSLLAVQSFAVDRILIDTSNTVKNLSESQKPVGFNLSYLLDSDIHYPRVNSTEEQFRQTMVGSLRFPYGHLANNYLWDADGEYGGQLTPKIATRTQSPGNWTWAVDGDGSFKKSMDFDEYMAICQRNGIEPLIVVNVMAHRYQDSVDFNTLLTSAVEWVRYSKSRGYNVKYWQLGNEQDHHRNKLPLSDSDGVLDDDNYLDIYQQMARAMKEVDPTIKVGPGLINKITWFDEIQKANPNLVDFIAVHQYSFAQPWSEGGYAGWRDWKGDMVKNVTRGQRKASQLGIDLLVTEMNITGTWPEGKGLADTYRALVSFEMQMETIHKPNLKYSYLWTTRSPWKGEQGEPDGSNYFYNDIYGDRTLMGDVVKIVNENLHDRLVYTSKPNAPVKAYASLSSADGSLSVYILNKSNSPRQVELAINGYDLQRQYRRRELSGQNCRDVSPSYGEKGSLNIRGKSVFTQLSGCSLTLITFEPQRDRNNVNQTLSQYRYTQPPTHKPARLDPLVADYFLNGDALAWEFRGNGGEVKVEGMPHPVTSRPSDYDNGLKITDKSPSNNISAIRIFPAERNRLRVEFALRADEGDGWIFLSDSQTGRSALSLRVKSRALSVFQNGSVIASRQNVFKRGRSMNITLLVDLNRSNFELYAGALQIGRVMSLTNRISQVDQFEINSEIQQSNYSLYLDYLKITPLIQ